MGDFNAAPEDLPPLLAAIGGGILHDIAAMEPLTEQSEPLRTCLAHGSKSRTRRDFVFTNSLGLQIVGAVKVFWEGAFDVHKPIVVGMRHQQMVSATILPMAEKCAKPPHVSEQEWRSTLADI
eukprot:14964718-Alexandrium_andersonii.AAC.1